MSIESEMFWSLEEGCTGADVISRLLLHQPTFREEYSLEIDGD
jgi:hypothetical protein